MPDPEVVYRDRLASDLEACVGALRRVHEADAYPLHWPDDPGGWLTPRGLLRAWVAEFPRGVVAGHVGLQGAGGEAELVRLFVVPEARRHAIGRGLLAQVGAWAQENDTAVTLNVVDERRSPAVALYEAAGWRHTHTTRADWLDHGGERVVLRHYVLVR